MRRRLAVIMLALFALSVAACAAVPAVTSDQQLGRFENGSTAADGAPSKAGSQGIATEQVGTTVPTAANPNRMLTLSASVAMRASDPWAASSQAQATATGLGGEVIGLSESGTAESRTANLTLRVPSDRFSEALRQLRALPDVEVVSSNVESKDVTDQFVDLEARLVAKRAEEERYVALLARAQTIDEILRIDGALAGVRTQIEQLTAQLNSIRQRTDFSTVSVSIVAATPGPVPGDPLYDPARTARAALAALAATFRVVADVAIWLVVFAAIPLALAASVLVLVRTRGKVPAPSR